MCTALLEQRNDSSKSVYNVCLRPQSLQGFTPPHWDQSSTLLGEFTAVQHLGGQSVSDMENPRTPFSYKISRAHQSFQCVPRSGTHYLHITAFLWLPSIWPRRVSSVLILMQQTILSLTPWHCSHCLQVQWSLLMVSMNTWMNMLYNTEATTYIWLLRLETWWCDWGNTFFILFTLHLKTDTWFSSWNT